jgi:hypothetical protein
MLLLTPLVSGNMASLPRHAADPCIAAVPVVRSILGSYEIIGCLRYDHVACSSCSDAAVQYHVACIATMQLPLLARIEDVLDRFMPSLMLAQPIATTFRH